VKILSTNIGRPRDIVWQGKAVQTGIYKEPVDEIRIRKFSVDGDNVSDLKVHGGETKAVYGYPSEHYEFWRREYPLLPMCWGMFGENITTEGLFENSILVGSDYRIGTAVLRVTEPRYPCYKLAAKFGNVDIIKRFMKSRKSGFYFTVLREGTIKPGDQILLEHEGNQGVTIEDVVNRHAKEN
jgi:MOSC domain-containing protein YiiM